MSNVHELPNRLEGIMKIAQNNLAESAVDLSMYCSYCYQRCQVGLSVNGMKKINFAPDSQIDAMELQMNKEIG